MSQICSPANSVVNLRMAPATNADSGNVMLVHFTTGGQYMNATAYELYQTGIHTTIEHPQY